MSDDVVRRDLDAMSAESENADVVVRARTLLQNATGGPWHLRYLGRNSVPSLSVCAGERSSSLDVLPIADVWDAIGLDRETDRETARQASSDAALIAACPALLQELCDELEQTRAGQEKVVAASLDVQAAKDDEIARLREWNETAAAQIAELTTWRDSR